MGDSRQHGLRHQPRHGGRGRREGGGRTGRKGRGRGHARAKGAFHIDGSMRVRGHIHPYHGHATLSGHAARGKEEVEAAGTSSAGQARGLAHQPAEHSAAHEAGSDSGHVGRLHVPVPTH